MHVTGSNQHVVLNTVHNDDQNLLVQLLPLILCRRKKRFIHQLGKQIKSLLQLK